MHQVRRALVLSLVLLAAAVSAQAVRFTVALGHPVHSLDPARFAQAGDQTVYDALFEGLVKLDGPSGAVLPALAERWETSADGLTWTFHLRDARWSDGVPVSSRDLAEAWLRALDPATGSEYAYLVSMLVAGAADYAAGSGPRAGVAVATPDERTVRFTTARPCPWALRMLSHPVFHPVPRHALAGLGGTAAFVGNGPFVPAAAQDADGLLLVRNPRYRGAAGVALDEVLFRAGDDAARLLADYRAGAIDWLAAVPPSARGALAGRPDFHRVPMYASYYLVVNCSVPPFDNPDVREAFSLSIDRAAMAAALEDAGMPAGSIVPPLTAADAPVPAEYDPERAGDLLARAGYPGGKRFPRTVYLYNASDRHRAVADWLAESWRESLGVRVPATPVAWNELLRRRSDHDFRIARAGWIADMPDPASFLELFESGNGNNDSAYRDAAYDALLEQARHESGAARDATLKRAEAILVRVRVCIPLYYYCWEDLIDTRRWSGWQPNTPGMHPLADLAPAVR